MFGAMGMPPTCSFLVNFMRGLVGLGLKDRTFKASRSLLQLFARAGAVLPQVPKYRAMYHHGKQIVLSWLLRAPSPHPLLCQSHLSLPCVPPTLPLSTSCLWALRMCWTWRGGLFRRRRLGVMEIPLAGLRLIESLQSCPGGRPVTGLARVWPHWPDVCSLRRLHLLLGCQWFPAW